MNSKIIFSSLSNSDLEKIVSHYHELNVSTAKRYYNSIIGLVKKLKKYPLLGRIVPECEDVFYDKYREVIFENFRIIYRIAGEQIVIIRILDARMDIDFTYLETGKTFS